MQKRSYQQLPCRYRPYDFPSAFPVLAFLGDYWQIDSAAPQYLHFHNGLEIGRCLGQDTLLYRESGNPLLFRAGDYSLVFRNQMHLMAGVGQPGQWEFIYVEPKRFLENVSGQGDELWQLFYLEQRISPLISSRLQPRLSFYLDHIFQELHRKQPLYQDAACGMLFSFFAELNHTAVRNGQDPLPPSPDGSLCIRTALSWIYEHYAEPVSVRDLAERCHVSESHLRRLFHASVGISPLDYIQHYRIRQACHLIHLNRDPINVIAGNVGYSSLSSFNRQFRQYLGQSPSAWKKEHLSSPWMHEVRSYEDPGTRYVFQI